MEKIWEDVDVGNDLEEDDVEDDDDIDWKLPSTLGSPSSKFPPEVQPLSLLAHSTNQCLQSKLGHSRTIVHIDLDCFYAQVEMLRDPTLREKPLGIQQKNIVVTTNYVARARGVSKLSYIKDALIKCPDLVLVSGEDLTNYRETSAKVTELLEQFCPLVERLGFDENFMDVTEMVESRLSLTDFKKLKHVGHSYGDEIDSHTATQCQCGCHERLIIGSHIAMEMRDSLKSKLGLTSCAGIATNKLLAKLIGGHHKPNDQTVLFSEWNDCFVQTLTKPRQIPGIGHSSGKKLKGIGIENLEELRAKPISTLAELFGKQQAEMILRLAHGIDDTPVVSKGLPQSLSDEDSFKKVGTLAAAKETMTGLIKNLIKRLRCDGRIPHTMRLTVRKYCPGSWQRESRQTSIQANLFHKQDDDFLLKQLLEVAVILLQKLLDTSRPFHLTLINICFTNLRSKVTKGAIDCFLKKPPGPKGMELSQTQSFSHGNNNNSLDSRVDTRTSEGLCVTRSKDNKGTIDSFFRKPTEESRNKVKLRHEGTNLSLLKKDDDKDAITMGFSTLVGKELVRDEMCELKIAETQSSSNRSAAFTSGEMKTSDQSPSFFKRLSHSPSKKSDFLNIEKNDAGTMKNVSLGMREQNSVSLYSDVDASCALHEDHVSDESVGGLKHSPNLTPAAKRTLAESLTNNGVDCALEGTAVKRMKNDSEHCSRRSTVDDEIGNMEIPPDIDRTVFDALPSDMKEELIRDWKRTKKQREDTIHLPSSSKNLSNNKKLSSSSKKKQLPVARNTITKYFKH